MYSAVGKARMVSPEQRKIEWDRAVKNVRKVCGMAKARGIKIALEPLNRFESDLINTVDDVLRFINDINHPAAAIMLDGFHMNIEERDVETAIIKAGDKLIHMQVSENYRGTPGTGQTLNGQPTGFPRCLTGANHEQHSFHLCGQQDRICEGQDRRSVHDDLITLLTMPPEQFAHSF